LEEIPRRERRRYENRRGFFIHSFNEERRDVANGIPVPFNTSLSNIPSSESYNFSTFIYLFAKK
jgi:hypothetical protein